MRVGWREIKPVLNKQLAKNHHQPFKTDRDGFALCYGLGTPSVLPKVHIRALLSLLPGLPSWVLLYHPIVFRIPAAELMQLPGWALFPPLTPNTVSHSFAFPSCASKWPPDQSLSELCLNRCNTKNWNQILPIAHVKGRKTISASQLPALRRPASVWEDKRKSLQPQQHFLSSCFLFILSFYQDRENL